MFDSNHSINIKQVFHQVGYKYLIELIMILLINELINELWYEIKNQRSPHITLDPSTCE